MFHVYFLFVISFLLPLLSAAADGGAGGTIGGGAGASSLENNLPSVVSSAASWQINEEDYNSTAPATRENYKSNSHASNLSSNETTVKYHTSEHPTNHDDLVKNTGVTSSTFYQQEQKKHGDNYVDGGGTKDHIKSITTTNTIKNADNNNLPQVLVDDVSSWAQFTSSLQKSLDACLTKNYHQASEISNNKKELQGLHQNLTLSESNQSFLQSNNTLLIKLSKECANEKNQLQQENNEIANQLKALRDKYNTKVSMLKSNIKELHKKLLNIESQNEQKSKRYSDSIEESNRLEKELQLMYIKSQSTYVNTTLIVEDVGWALMKALDQIVEVCENILYSNIVTELHSKATHFFLKPIRNRVLTFYKYLHRKVPFGKWLKSVDFIEGTRLTLVSVITNGSKAALNCLETIKFATHLRDYYDNDFSYRTNSRLSRQRHHDYIYRHHGLGRSRGEHTRRHYPISKNKKISKTGPRVYHQVKILLRYTENNAENVVNFGFTTISVVIVFMAIRKMLQWLMRKATGKRKSTI